MRECVCICGRHWRDFNATFPRIEQVESGSQFYPLGIVSARMLGEALHEQEQKVREVRSEITNERNPVRGVRRRIWLFAENVMG